MTTFGNTYWNSATDNKYKSIISCDTTAYEKFKDKLDKSGINYYGYTQNNAVRIAVDDKDINWLKEIIGTSDISVQKSSKEFTPPEKNIIGNTAYKYIADKTYFSSDRDTLLKMAEILNNQNIKFSGRIYENGKGTLTVSTSSIDTVRAVNAQIISMRKQFVKPDTSRVRDGSVIGNTKYSEIQNKHFLLSPMKPDEYLAIKDSMENQNIRYSGLIRDNKVMFTVEENDAMEFTRIISSEYNRHKLIKELSENNNLSEHQIALLENAITTAAEKDRFYALTTNINADYTDEQLVILSEKIIAYISQSEQDQMLDKNNLYSDIIKTKSQFDQLLIVGRITEGKNYSDEQINALLNAIHQGLTEVVLDQLDNTYTPDEINEYINIFNRNDVSALYSFLEEHNTREAVADAAQNILFDVSEEQEELHTDVSEPNNKFSTVSEMLENISKLSSPSSVRSEFGDGKTFLIKEDDTENNPVNCVSKVLLSIGETVTPEEALRYINEIPSVKITAVYADIMDADYERSVAKRGHSLIRRLNPSEFASLLDYTQRAAAENNPDYNRLIADADHVRKLTNEAHDTLIEYLNNPELIPCIIDKLFARDQMDDIYELFKNGKDKTSIAKKYIDTGSHSITIPGTEISEEHQFFPVGISEFVDVRETFSGLSFNVGDFSADYNWGQLGNFLEKAANDYWQHEDAWTRLRQEFTGTVDSETEKNIRNAFNTVRESYTLTEKADNFLKAFENTLAAKNIDFADLDLMNGYPFVNNYGSIEYINDQMNGKLFEFADRINEILSRNEQELTEVEKDEQEINEEASVYKIYQLKEGEEYHYARFSDYESNEHLNLSVNDYELKYEDNFNLIKNKYNPLDEIYTRFNINRPEDFTGHSLSVSDVIVIEKADDRKAYYVDSFGFQEMQDFFLKREKQIETEAEVLSPVGTKTDTTPEKTDEPLFKEAYTEEFAEAKKKEETYSFEQMSMFGDNIPLSSEAKPNKKSYPDFIEGVSATGLLEKEIMLGSGFEDGKFRIEKFFKENNPDTKQFADFLKKEYGIGGHSAPDNMYPISFINHDAKGLEFNVSGGENFTVGWTDTAKKITELINSNKYITENDINKRIKHYQYILENYDPETNWDKPKIEQAKEILKEYGVLNKEKSEPISGIHVSEGNTEDENNYKIEDENLGKGGPKEKFRNNIEAIRTLKQTEIENRPATDAEKETLAKYVGWGGLYMAFDPSNEAWKKEYSELKGILSDKEYRSASASTLDSFYTSPVIVESMYTALKNFGFDGGNLLEPACGVGNFIGCIPDDIVPNTRTYGVELDSISGRIASKLYPDADIQVKGFEKTKFQDGCFDVAIGNVPFGDTNLTYKGESLKIHDYFFMQALDKVKDGGIIAFITSTGTLDKKSEKFRKELADKADLIGAVRLPSGAFKANAGTDVTSDIIFLQKRSNPTERTPEWIYTSENENGLSVNNYFIQNPDMILGELVKDSNPFSNGTKVIAKENSDLKSELAEAVSKLSATISDEHTNDVFEKREPGAVIPPEDIKNYSLFKSDDKIYFHTTDGKSEFMYDKNSSVFKRAEAYIELRDTTRALLTAQEQNQSDDTIHALQEKLSKQYDNFYVKFGLLHSRTNKKHFSEDISYNLALSLEKSFEKDKLIEKSDIFTKRTIKPAEAVTHVETAIEALTLSSAEKAKVDFEYMTSLTGLSKPELIAELHGEIFQVPNSIGEYQTANEYLSGDIRQKLNIAQKAVEDFPQYKENIAALEAVMPEPLKAGDIEVKIGATWIDPKIYDQFMYETFETPHQFRNDVKHSYWERNVKPVQTEYSEASGAFEIQNKREDKSVNVTQNFGTKKMSAYEIMESLLNLKDPKITKKIQDPETGDEKRVIDIEATKIAQRKADKIRSTFSEWIFKDPERRDILVGKYNELFNSIRPREFDGSNLNFPNMNADIKLHEHQKNAIAHAMFGGNTLFAHSVGAGKTFEMIATAMESKRLGLCTKSLFVVPNHLTEQIGSDFQKLYPSANILIASKNDFKRENRQQLFAKIATGNFDAVIIGHSQLKMIPMSVERQTKILTNQIEDITQGIAALKEMNGSKFQIKQMERTKKTLDDQLAKLGVKKQDETVTFEEMGIDKLFVDEAHEFKNLFTTTKLQNISGISTTASQKALDLFTKCQYLDEKTNGKGVVFATGTPLSNSVTELHTMMRYLEYDFLKSKGLNNFDNWVTVFGSQKTDWELAPAGNKFKQRTRIANYTGLPELMSMFKQIADVRTADTLKLDVPECEMHVVNVEATDFQKVLVQELADRADDVQDTKVDPSIDNMLRITSDGRKLGLDPRLIDSSFEDNPGTKLNQCVNNVFNIYQETAADKLTQIIFCDLGVPHKTSSDPEKEVDNDEKSVSEQESFEEECDFCVYDDIKKKLTDKGVPENEIAFIHDAKTEKQKSELFEKVRKGDVRVLIGSTPKMGTGTNVQDRLIALHDLDIPWRPADMEQRMGRAVRQGNQNKKVHVYRYVTKGTFDSYSYQTLECKQKFIAQIMTSKTPVRKCEDVDQQALTYGEIKALCTGDERIKEKMQLDNEVKELRILKAEYTNTLFDMQDKVRNAPAQEEKLINSIHAMHQDLNTLRKLPVDEETKLPVFSITVGDTTYTDKTEAAKALESMTFGKLMANMNTSVPIGNFQGFDLSVYMDSFTKTVHATLKGEAAYTVEFGASYAHNLKKLEAALYRIDSTIAQTESKLNQLRVDTAEAQKIVNTPFAHENELNTKAERLDTLTDELNKVAMEEKMNNPNKTRTAYFDRAKLKKEAMKAKKVEKNQGKNKDMVVDKSKRL
ncbi:MAG: YodL domain-containing protein [Oscillospiraceae bacterium]|nr:YodL domain-containing protein [Oscillospiraceae bacterium]